MPEEDFYVSPAGCADGVAVTFGGRSSALPPILRHYKDTKRPAECITIHEKSAFL